MTDLINELQKLIEEYYETELEGYTFKSEEAENEIWLMVDNLKDLINDIVRDNDFQIECELNDSTVYVPNADEQELEKYRI